ncbi:ubiquitin-fold modifier 1 isoform X1 [Megalopta genalis]|uniref:ubiquitin-fold modifier 1 isoform X1 n=1 Tax=Megalopta genalis TaxID=115081 RepID=UPI003FD0CE35
MLYIMSELDISEVFNMFDIFLALLKNPAVRQDLNVNNVTKAFHCALFIESTIANVTEIGKENVLECHLHNHWLKENNFNSYKCLDFKYACDKLLEVCLKDPTVSTDTIDEFLRLYTEYCGSDRLNASLRSIVINGVSTNIVVDSLQKLGVSISDMKNEALILSWELQLSSNNKHEISECIGKMFDDGFHLELIRFAVNSYNNSKILHLIVQQLSNKLTENDAKVCIAFANLDKKSLWSLMESNAGLYANFLDAIFYFARHMTEVHTHGTCGFEYEHLLKVVRILLNGPNKISEKIYNRMQLVKAHPNGTIWNKVEKSIG